MSGKRVKFLIHTDFYWFPSSEQNSTCDYVDVMLPVLGNTSAADLTSRYKTSGKHPCTAEDRGHKDDICHSRLLLHTL